MHPTRLQVSRNRAVSGSGSTKQGENPNKNLTEAFQAQLDTGRIHIFQKNWRFCLTRTNRVRKRNHLEVARCCGQGVLSASIPPSQCTVCVSSRPSEGCSLRRTDREKVLWAARVQLSAKRSVGVRDRAASKFLIMY